MLFCNIQYIFNFIKSTESNFEILKSTALHYSTKKHFRQEQKKAISLLLLMYAFAIAMDGNCNSKIITLLGQTQISSSGTLQSPTTRNTKNCNLDMNSSKKYSKNKNNVILPHLSPIMKRPSTASLSATKSNSQFKVKLLNSQYSSSKTRSTSTTSNSHLIRPRTAPHHINNYESLHKSKIKNPFMPITDGTSTTTLNHKESFREKQEKKYRKRCEIYAINAVMKAAFEREFESLSTGIGKGQKP